MRVPAQGQVAHVSALQGQLQQEDRVLGCKLFTAPLVKLLHTAHDLALFGHVSGQHELDDEAPDQAILHQGQTSQEAALGPGQHFKGCGQVMLLIDALVVELSRALAEALHQKFICDACMVHVMHHRCDETGQSHELATPLRIHHNGRCGSGAGFGYAPHREQGVHEVDHRRSVRTVVVGNVRAVAALYLCQKACELGLVKPKETHEP
mmetsp:Transcript_63913/g.148899  ORF Transcript_63913/g.148899 Transcript_63913/m.148899 type:complete len:208 (+) Transcript_63913:377-1000(+)